MRPRDDRKSTHRHSVYYYLEGNSERKVYSLVVVVVVVVSKSSTHARSKIFSLRRSFKARRNRRRRRLSFSFSFPSSREASLSRALRNVVKSSAMVVAEYRASSRSYICFSKSDAVVLVFVTTTSRSIVWTISSKSLETHSREGRAIFVLAEESQGVLVTLERRNLRRTGFSDVEDGARTSSCLHFSRTRGCVKKSRNTAVAEMSISVAPS